MTSDTPTRYGLTDDEQRAIVMHFVDCYPMCDVAMVLGKSQRAVRCMIERGTAKLVSQGLPRPVRRGRLVRADVLPIVRAAARLGITDLVPA